MAEKKDKKKSAAAPSGRAAGKAAERPEGAAADFFLSFFSAMDLILLDLD